MSLIKEFADLALADPAPVAATAHPVFLSQPLADIALEANPVEPSWVISGRPEARSKVHSRSADDFSSTTIWECTAGAFRWHFEWDETVHILEGAVTITDETGRITTIRQGDVAYFAAGTWATWEIETYVKKIAFCRRAFPAPVVAALSLKERFSALLRGRKAAAAGGFGATSQPQDLPASAS
ncbi:cupin domain-containing protein [Methylopila sp. M107]|uniref:cupin domain-containing protein n=1 Tax=Methylopila sp. M107 TaxID=1101190 RepID=UPI00036DFEFF|nr:cupin domain-containing protein [Methylopila sp. M107]